MYRDRRRSEIEAFFVNRFPTLDRMGQTEKPANLVPEAERQAGINPLLLDCASIVGQTPRLNPPSSSKLVVAQDLINRQKFEDAGTVLGKCRWNNCPRPFSAVTKLLSPAGQRKEAIAFLKGSQLSLAETHFGSSKSNVVRKRHPAWIAGFRKRVVTAGVAHCRSEGRWVHVLGAARG
jgi:hypothetical protein